MNIKRSPILFLITLFASISLACAGSSAAPTAIPEPTATSTATPQPAATETATPPPTRTPVPSPTPFPTFFKEEMDQRLDAKWDFFIHGDSGKNVYSFSNSEMIIKIDEPKGGVEFKYTPYYYSDVRLDALFDNKPESRNTINVTLLCRFSDDGFYQAIITNDGRYVIYAYDFNTQKGDVLFEASSLAINQGKGKNEYGLQCKGNTITLFINGQEVKTVEENKLGLQEGFVGIYVGAIENLIPVIVGIDWIEIREP
jgi:hypothetical protein